MYVVYIVLRLLWDGQYNAVIRAHSARTRDAYVPLPPPAPVLNQRAPLPSCSQPGPGALGPGANSGHDVLRAHGEGRHHRRGHEADPWRKEGWRYRIRQGGRPRRRRTRRRPSVR